MEFFDTHCHYNDEAFNEDREEIIKSIYEEGITKAVVVGDNIENSKKAVELAKNYGEDSSKNFINGILASIVKE